MVLCINQLIFVIKLDGAKPCFVFSVYRYNKFLQTPSGAMCNVYTFSTILVIFSIFLIFAYFIRLEKSNNREV